MVHAINRLSIAVLLLIYLFTTGYGQQCELSTIEVQQTNTGLKVGSDTVFEVEIKNLCGCTVTNVVLRSEGFASSMPVDPKLFRLESGGYLVGDGKGIPSSLSIKFHYAWDHYFNMSPLGFQIACSKRCFG